MRIRSLAAGAIIVSIVASACTIDAGQRPETDSALRGGAATLRPEPVASVVERVLPAVVNVTTDVFTTDQFGNAQEGQGVGTGFIVRADGVIVTNCHVVEQASKITVFSSDQQPRQWDARVIGGDCLHDLAVLKVDETGLPTVPLGESASLQLGQSVVALGYALALEGGPSVTQGIVSSLDRTVRAQDPACKVCVNGVRVYEDVIQTDAAINRGNSGGPLVDLAGRVVGINSAGSDSAENIGFAIAIDAVKAAIEQAIAEPLAPVAYLGVSSQDVTADLAFQLGLGVESGAYVVAASGDGPAAGAGIREGDVIVAIDDREVASAEDVGVILDALRPGTSVTVDIVGPGGARSIDVVLGTRPLPVDLP